MVYGEETLRMGDAEGAEDIECVDGKARGGYNRIVTRQISDHENKFGLSSHTPSIKVTQVDSGVIDTQKRRRIFKQLPRTNGIWAKSTTTMLETKTAGYVVRAV